LELPRIVHLGPNLFGAAFSLMKLLPARHILDRARDDGLLEPGTVVIESTSGTFGLALAMEGPARSSRLQLAGSGGLRNWSLKIPPGPEGSNGIG